MQPGSLVSMEMVEFSKAEAWHQLLIISTMSLRVGIKSHVARLASTGLLDHDPWSRCPWMGAQPFLKMLELEDAEYNARYW